MYYSQIGNVNNIIINFQVQNGAIIPDNIIDFYNLRFRTLHPLSDFHGPNSPQTKEAKKLLGKEINKTVSFRFIQI